MKCCLVYSIVLLQLFYVNDVYSEHRFRYGRPEQKRWSKKHGHCGGKYQSPIAITSSKAIPLNLPAIDMIGYHNLLPAPIKLINNGHTINLSIRNLEDKEVEQGDFIPYISGGKLGGQYEVNSLHFHWGDKNNRGAEHVINDIRYAMEMHIVHKNKKYKTMEDALAYSDGLAVMAFLYRVSEIDAPEMNAIAKCLPSLKNVNDAMELPITFSLASLFERVDLDRYYTYKGSLTTPPCSEVVTWVVFPDPLEISQTQLSKFRHLHSTEDGAPLVDNFRALQPLANRRIFVRKVNTRGQSIEELDEVHCSKWEWFS